MFNRFFFCSFFQFSIPNKNSSNCHYRLDKYQNPWGKYLSTGLIFLLLISTDLVGQQRISTRKSGTSASPRQKVTKTNSSKVKGWLVNSIDEYLKRATAFGFSGAVLIAKDNKIVLNGGYGLADRASGKPITAETVFDIGSITKQFTAAAIMKLEELGKLSVQNSITKYFDNVPEDKRGITIHHLLTHSSGIALYSGEDYELITRDTLVKRVLLEPLRFKPGERHAYSNPGYGLLSVIIEKVSGEPYEAYIHRHLLLPAGMENTGYTAPYWKNGTLAHGYRGIKDEGTPLDRTWWGDGPSWNLRGNGGFLSTLDDLYRWHLTLERNKVLSEASKRKMISPHVATQNANSYSGYGWFISRTPRGTRLVSHSGSNGIFFMNFRRYVDEGVVMIFATNDYRYDREIEGRIESQLFGENQQLPPVQTINIPASELSRYAGTYQLPSGATFTVSIVDGQLAIDPAQPEIGMLLTKFPPVNGINRNGEIEGLVSRVIFGIVNKDFEPLKQILRQQTPFQGEKEFWGGAFDSWQEQWGKLQRAEVIGSQERDGQIGTYVLLRFERGTRMILFLQNKEGKYFISANPPPISPDLYRLVPLSKIEFAAYNLLLSSGTTIDFQLVEGQVKGLNIKGEKGYIQAKKIN